MDTLVMAVRCALLIVVTGMFAALWSSDVPENVRVNDPSPRIPVEHRNSQPKAPVRSYNSLESESGDDAASAGQPTSNDGLHAPLPDDIAAGTYVIVDQLGRSETRVISVKDRTAPLNMRDHYLIESGNSRWHFIRLDSSNLDRTAVIPSTESVVR